MQVRKLLFFVSSYNVVLSNKLFVSYFVVISFCTKCRSVFRFYNLDDTMCENIIFTVGFDIICDYITDRDILDIYPVN